ncbi:uncharacterized protein LOC143042648 isoform X2 [Mytilus galloprovincialis]|uniref:uncharacterized protein LOC143042648 isoform X2 n=1 Tax=Mytilus galloprovincialis TaxID=29158 RepID=UPI003F7B61AF
METMADVLLCERLKKLKVDVDNIDLKPVSEGSYVSYRNKKSSGTEIDSLFGEMQFKEGKARMEKSESQQNTRPKKSQKRYKYTCAWCGNEQVLTNEPVTKCYEYVLKL